jgi:nickel superoxide dismutase
MIDLIKLTKDAHQIARYTAVKEEHAEILKREVRVLWGDYFKEAHEKEHPELPKLIKEALQLGSKARQGTDRKTGEELLATVQKIAGIFWKTQGLEPVRTKAPYPTGGEVVLYKQ